LFAQEILEKGYSLLDSCIDRNNDKNLAIFAYRPEFAFRLVFVEMDWNAPEFGPMWNEGVSHFCLHTGMRNSGMICM
jgi:hypothetical protein